MSSKRRSKNNYRPLHMEACKPKKNRMELLFDKIRQQEQERRDAAIIADVNAPVATTDTPQQAPGELDKHIEEELNKPVRKFHVIDAGKGEIVSRKLKSYAFSDDQENEEWYIKKDEKLASSIDYPTILKMFVNLLEHVSEQHILCNNKLANCDRKIQDFLHELRMPKRNAYEGFKLYQLGHHLELERQAYKDALVTLTPLANFANANPDVFTKLRNILQKLEDQQQLRGSRIYMPRSDLDLPVGDAFRALSQEEQDRIRQNYESSRRAG